MISTKPEVPAEEARELIVRCLNVSADDLTAVADGQIAQTFSFEAGGQRFFLQFDQSNMAQARRTEALFGEQFRALGIPVREVVAHGVHQDYPFTISRKVRGTPLTALDEAGFRSHIPALIATMLRLSQVHPQGSSGFGWLDASGNGSFATWTDHLRGIRTETPGDFYDDWHRLFTTSFLEKERFDSTFAAMETQLRFVPDQRCLVHGDLGYGNVFVEDGRVSALLDWQNCRWGDPVFDLAVVIFWRDAPTASELVAAYRLAAGPLPHFDERLHCYRLYLGLDALRFSARTDNRGMYDHVVGLLAKIEAGAP